MRTYQLGLLVALLLEFPLCKQDIPNPSGVSTLLTYHVNSFLGPLPGIPLDVGRNRLSDRPGQARTQRHAAACEEYGTMRMLKRLPPNALQQTSYTRMQSSVHRPLLPETGPHAAGSRITR